MAVVRDLDQMLAWMRPQRRPGAYVFSCNLVAATHHDHLFVPAGAADDAVRLLEGLSARHRLTPDA